MSSVDPFVNETFDAFRKQKSKIDKISKIAEEIVSDEDWLNEILSKKEHIKVKGILEKLIDRLSNDKSNLKTKNNEQTNK